MRQLYQLEGGRALAARIGLPERLIGLLIDGHARPNLDERTKILQATGIAFGGEP